MEEIMNINLKQLVGNWDKGFALDKHVVSSTFIGYNEAGYPQYETLRTEVGEALFQMKYRGDLEQSKKLAQEIYEKIYPYYSDVDFVIPMPATVHRQVQPVFLLAQKFSLLAEIPCITNLLYKEQNPYSIKDLNSKDERKYQLNQYLKLNPCIKDGKQKNVLLIDDIYDTGASLEVACQLLNNYDKIGNIYVATVTWR